MESKVKVESQVTNLSHLGQNNRTSHFRESKYIQREDKYG